MLKARGRKAQKVRVDFLLTLVPPKTWLLKTGYFHTSSFTRQNGFSRQA